MAIREVTKKRKGKAKKRTTAANKTFLIRVMRASFFILIGVIVVYFYYLYEKGSLLEFYRATNIQEGFKLGITYLQEHPFRVSIYIFYTFTILGVGYAIGKKKKY
jgi:ABC-type methionine transport system permease subunit